MPHIQDEGDKGSREGKRRGTRAVVMPPQAQPACELCVSRQSEGHGPGPVEVALWLGELFGRVNWIIHSNKPVYI